MTGVRTKQDSLPYVNVTEGNLIPQLRSPFIEFQLALSGFCVRSWFPNFFLGKNRVKTCILGRTAALVTWNILEAFRGNCGLWDLENCAWHWAVSDWHHYRHARATRADPIGPTLGNPERMQCWTFFHSGQVLASNHFNQLTASYAPYASQDSTGHATKRQTGHFTLLCDLHRFLTAERTHFKNPSKIEHK